ncbi:MAG: type 1 glutamine amidotransferase [Halobacteriaceae archaeon]
MTRLRMALLDASHGADHTRRDFRRELDADLEAFDVTAGELPPSFAYDAAVVTGSASSVYADDPWIADLLTWLRDAHGAGLPMLGVCYGHQALAAALGGRVEPMGEYEIGYREIRRRAEDPLFAGVPERFLAFTTHQDTVTELPPDATLLAENDFGVHAFRVDDAVGVQFHPEYDRESATTVTRGKLETLGEARTRAVLADVSPENYALAQAAKRLFDNFTDGVRARRDAAPAST